MKKTFVKFMLFSALFLGAYWSASAQIYVRVRPIAPVIVRTERPSSAHVWIGEEWNSDGGSYRYSGGHWDAPPHQGDRWGRGHWSHDREHGNHWVNGSWRGSGRKR